MTEARKRTTRTDRRHDRDEPSPDQLLDRSPPHSLEAERGVLASMLLDPRVIDDIVLIVKAEHFFSGSHRTIFKAIKAVHDNPRTTVDLTLVIEKLKAGGDLEVVGGAEAIEGLYHLLPIASNGPTYAAVVAEKHQARELLTASLDTMRDLFGEAGEEHGEIKHVLERAERRVFAISETNSESHTSDMSTAITAWMLDFDTRKQGEAKGIPIGYDEIDRRIGGLRGGELTIIAARPSMGKSAFAMNIARLLAELRGKASLFVTLEMSRIELVERLLACTANVTLTRLRNNWINPHERRLIVEATSTLSQLPLFIDEAPSRSVSEIAAMCRRMKRKGSLDALFVDYLQLVEAENAKDPREQQVAKIARRLKTLARELKIPVIVLSQLNRESEKSGDNKPKLGHLRESGAIEQDADNVVFVHRPAYYMPEGSARDECKEEAEIIWAKVRNGETGTDKLRWRGEYQRFENARNEDLPT